MSCSTGKSLSEVLLLAEHVVYKNCSECQKQFLYNMLSQGLSLEFSCTELVSYCGLVDAKIRLSDKDLPVIQTFEVSTTFSHKIFALFAVLRSRQNTEFKNQNNHLS